MSAGMAVIKGMRLWRWPGLAMLVWLLAGCAGVTVSSVSPTEYLAQRRGDVLTTGRLSDAARDVLRIAGIEDCRERPVPCRAQVEIFVGLSDEQRLSVLAELWLEAALAADKAGEPEDVVMDAWLQSARHAYAYLFFTKRRPGERAFEDRQTQVRDYYNYATQQTITRLFRRARYLLPQPSTSTDISAMPIKGWQLRVDAGEFRLPGGATQPDEVVAAASLRFTGLRNTYRRDGFGAELVAVAPKPAPVTPPPAYEEMRYPAVTVLMGFSGKTLAQVLATREVQLHLYDPNHSAQVQLAGETIPLAANFTAGYGLWLARSGFATQSLRTLFGLAEGIVRPSIQLMQPYDPKRRTIVMLHGLASSPEAWINVANEVLGDEVLRRNYQIWQVYYPSNAPLPLNLKAIRDALQQTLDHVDPLGTAPASHDMVLIGHSMGGVLARLLVSSSGENLLSALPELTRFARPWSQARREELLARIEPYLEFEPMPQMGSAIFIAAPHRGTPFAGNRLARRIANLITLPVSLLEQVGDISGLLSRLPNEGSSLGVDRIPNSIDNLRDTDPFVRAAARLPIAPHVRYHSIIGQTDPAAPLALSSDGIVPYSSAHLQGAVSERVVPSSHSVQEHPLAILEVRRILREQLERDPVQP
jgi:triacylglycerol esterase/lipase EstA (alpha/beta hydrolase family)